MHLFSNELSAMIFSLWLWTWESQAVTCFFHNVKFFTDEIRRSGELPEKMQINDNHRSINKPVILRTEQQIKTERNPDDD